MSIGEGGPFCHSWARCRAGSSCRPRITRTMTVASSNGSATVPVNRPHSRDTDMNKSFLLGFLKSAANLGCSSYDELVRTARNNFFVFIHPGEPAYGEARWPFK